MMLLVIVSTHAKKCHAGGRPNICTYGKQMRKLYFRIGDFAEEDISIKMQAAPASSYYYYSSSSRHKVNFVAVKACKPSNKCQGQQTTIAVLL